MQVEGHEETSWYHDKDEQAMQSSNRPHHVRPFDDNSGFCSGHSTFLSVRTIDADASMWLDSTSHAQSSHATVLVGVMHMPAMSGQLRTLCCSC